MTKKSGQLKGLWHELKRRQVLGAISVYAGVAFIILQVVVAVKEPLNLPDWVPTLIIILLAIGFPVVFIFSWIYHISSRGITKTEPETSSGEKALKEAVKTAPVKSIIVLPFENISPDPDQNYFSDGLTEEIITDLSPINDILVISRTSAMTYKGSKKKITEIASEVNVHYVLEGSVRKAGNDLKITAQLIDAEKDMHIWAEKFSGTIDDVFKIQEKVSRSIAEALKLKLNQIEKSYIVTASGGNVRLYDLILQARNKFYEASPESVGQAVQMLQNAIELFGENSLLYSAIGEAKYQLYEVGIDSSESNLNEIEKYVRKALSLDPDSASAHKMLGYVERGRGNLFKAYEHLKTAYKLDPNDPGVLGFYVLFRGTYFGKHSGIELLENRLLTVDPLSILTFAVLGTNQYSRGNFPEAIELFRNCSKLYPGVFVSEFWQVIWLVYNNQKDEAFKLAERLIADMQIPPVLRELILFFTHVVNKRKEQALKVLSEETIHFVWNDPDLPQLVAGWYSSMDENEEALKYLEHAIGKGFINYPFFSEVDPFISKIRNVKPFKKLMEKLKYQWENFEV